MPGILETAVKAIDGGDQSARHRVQVAALAGGQVHGGRERGSGLLRIQSGAGEVQRGGGRVLHAEGGVCRRVLHGLVQQLSLFLGVAHRLVGELHGLIDFRKARRARCADSDQRQGEMGRERLARVLHLAAELLHLLASGGDLLRLYGAEVLILLFQAFKALLRLGNLTLEGVVLILRNGAVFQSLFGLLGGFLQRVQLFLGGADLLLERLILLGEKLGIAGVHFEELVDILQLGLGVFYLRIDAFEGGFQLCGIAADFDCDALYSAPCQCCRPLSKWLKGVHLRLRSDFRVIVAVVIAFDVHIVDEPDRQQVQVADGYAELDAAQQEQRRGHPPFGSGPFFLAVDCVCTFSPHSSMICGSTW